MPSWLHAPGLGHRQQQEVELVQAGGQMRQEAARGPAGHRALPCFAVRLLVVLVQQPGAEARLEDGKREGRRHHPAVVRRVAGELTEEQLLDGAEEPLDRSLTTRLAGQGKDELDLQVGGHLLDVPGGEIAAVIGVERCGNATNWRAWVAGPPDRFAEGERRM